MTSRLIVNSIRHTGASADAITLDNSGNATFPANVTCSGTATGFASRLQRNLIINGAMIVAQRGTSSTTNGYGSVDRFRVFFTGLDESPTQAQADVAAGTTPYTSGFRKCLKVTNGNQTSGAGAGDYLVIRTTLEAQDIANSGWNYTSSSSNVTFQFWIKSSVAQNFYGRLQTQDGTTYNFPFETGSLRADTWTKITKTIPGNSNLTFNNDNGGGLRVEIIPFYGTDYTASPSLDTWAAHSSSSRTPDYTSTWFTTNDATFEITGLQLEVSDSASDFEHRSFQQELTLCQRYFERIGGNGGYDPIGNGMQRETNQSLFQSYFKAPKRAAPTVTLVGDVITTDRFSFDQVISSLGFAITSTEGLHGRADHSSVGAQRRPIFITSANSGTAGSITLDAEL